MRSPRIATKNSPRSPQLEKARVQQRRANAARKKGREGGRKEERKKGNPNSVYSEVITFLPPTE